jgi:hypothetical protein
MQMILTKTWNMFIAEALSLSGATFGDGLKFKLVKNSFVPSPTLVLADLTLAAFTGSAPKVIAGADQSVVRNEETGGYGVQVIEPVGGLNFVCTAAPAEPETIYGYIVTDSADALIGSALLEQQKIIAQIGDFVEVPATLGYFPASTFES